MTIYFDLLNNCMMQVKCCVFSSNILEPSNFATTAVNRVKTQLQFCQIHEMRLLGICHPEIGTNLL